MEKPELSDGCLVLLNNYPKCFTSNLTLISAFTFTYPRLGVSCSVDAFRVQACLKDRDMLHQTSRSPHSTKTKWRFTWRQ